MINNKFVLGTKSYDAIEFEEYAENDGQYDAVDTAIVSGDYVYPIRSAADHRPGVYKAGSIYHFIDPVDDEDKEIYSSSKVINFRDQTSLKDIISQQSVLKDQERVILTTPDNIYMPKHNDDDSQAIAGLKEAIERKHIDLDKYEPRFGNNYANDKRILMTRDITLTKLTTMANALDIGLTLVFTDKSKDIPNPMGGTIYVDLLGDKVDFVPETEE